MLALTLHQMRSGWARLIAAGLAIMLGTGFVAASMLGGEVMKSAAYQSFTSDYAGADLVVTSSTGSSGLASPATGPFTPETIAEIARSGGIAAVENKAQIGAIIETQATAEWAPISAVTPGSADLLEAGELPRTDSQIALSTSVADRLSVQTGDELALTLVDPEGGSDVERTFTLTGLLAPGTDLFDTGAAALISAESFNSPDLAFATSGGPLALTLEAGTDPTRAAVSLQEDLGSAYSVSTVTDLAESTMESLTGSTTAMRNLLLGFAGVALAVAALVIGNTFSVIVAQRTRHLALLRTVGASRGQVRRSVLTEALLLGLISAIAGVGLGYGVIALAITLLTPSVPGINLWQGMTLSPAVWIATVATGLVLTLVAGWAPARSATRVRPLEALRPEPVRLGTTAGKFRATVSALAFLGGAALLVTGVVFGREDDGATLGLALGVLGGFLSVFGIVLGSVFVITPLVRAVGSLFGRGVPATVATMGAVRNPRRTATTTNALFIGVGLVAMMATGAATAKVTLDAELQANFPVDMEVFSEWSGGASGDSITPAQVEAAGAVEGVSQVVPVAVATLDTSDGSFEVYAPAPEAAAGAGAIVDDPGVFADLAPGEVLIPSWVAGAYDLTTGSEITGTGITGAGAGEQVTLTVAGIRDVSGGLLTAPETLARLDPALPVRMLWIDLAEGADPALAHDQTQDALSEAQGPVVSVYSSAVERQAFGTIIDTLLLIVSAMLAVAIVIALVGVANTLSLSVIERRRESATLRALGLTRGQLRGMLAIEGVIIAVVGALAGVIGGLAYGWAGASTLLGAMGDVHLAAPWGMIAAVLLVAGAAGLIASMLPARSAVRVPPVAALAQE